MLEGHVMVNEAGMEINRNATTTPHVEFRLNQFILIRKIRLNQFETFQFTNQVGF